MSYTNIKASRKNGWNSNTTTKSNIKVDIGSITLWVLVAMVSAWGLMRCGNCSVVSIVLVLSVIVWGICIIKCHAYMSKIELGGIGLLMGIFLPPIINVIIAAISWKIINSIESISFNK